MPHYVIVGGGSAGCVLASRLSEDPAVEVVLIEAGGADSAPEFHIPSAQGKLRKSQYDWDYSTLPEPELDGRLVYLPRGKVLGGCSSINVMIHVRGHRADFDGWAHDGATGWSYNDVLPYFRKSESAERADAFHGVSGPQPVADARHRHSLSEAFVRAAAEAGYPANADFNGASQEGVGFFQVTQRNGRRFSAAAAYLRPAMSRPNLKVTIAAHATRILFDGLRACGVEILRGGRLEEIRVEEEVVVTSGAYNSPQLLLLSGLGPAADLKAHGIGIRQDLPVGLGLQDHPKAFLEWRTRTPSFAAPATAENVALFENEGRGPLASNGAEAGAFVRTRSDLDAPDLQFIAVPAMYYDPGLRPHPGSGISLTPCVIKPTSRGKVSLRGTNPQTKPRIVHNYFATLEDRQCMIEGVRIALGIAAQPALREHITEPHTVPKSETESDVWQFIQRYTDTIYHPTSTCAIGPVVDNQLRVHGVDGLRVADASVMPSIVRGNTNAATLMIAEKASDLIRAHT